MGWRGAEGGDDFLSGVVLFELRPAGHGGVSLAIGREIACQVEALRWERV